MSLGQFPKSPLKLLFSAASSDALDLLGKLLAYDPRKRGTAREVPRLYRLLSILADRPVLPEALHHPYFFALPYPTHPSNLPKTLIPMAPRALQEETEGQDALLGVDSHKPALKKKKGVKRKAVELEDDEREGLARSVSKRLDFT